MRFFVLPIFDGVIMDGHPGFICQKISLHHFIGFNLNNYTPYENKCFNPRNQIHRAEFVTRVNSVCVQMRHAICGVYAR